MLSECMPRSEDTGAIPIVKHHRNLRLAIPPRDPLDVQPDPTLSLGTEATALLHDERTYVFDRPFAFRADSWGYDFREQSKAALEDVGRRFRACGWVPVVVLLCASQDDLVQCLSSQPL